MIGAILGLIGSALSAQSNTGNKESEKSTNAATSNVVNTGFNAPDINNADVKPVESSDSPKETEGEKPEKMDWGSIGQLANELESAYGKQSVPLVQANNIAGR